MTTTYGVKYIGSKNSLIDTILGTIDEYLDRPERLRVIDVFTGTTRVAQAFRSRGWTVKTSDLSWASEAYANAFLLRTTASGSRIPALIQALQGIPPATDWITRNYCDVSGVEGGLVRMWKPENGRKADAIRNTIQAWKEAGQITGHEAMILVACLIFALDKVDSSVGIQQAYLKDWSKRAGNSLALEDLPFYPGGTVKHYVGNCLETAYETADVAYLDPPYSAHSYSTYYHIWDSITRWDKPPVSLTTNRRVDRVAKSEAFDPAMTSAWNRKSDALGAFIQLCLVLPVRYILISYSDESLIPLDRLVEGLQAEFGEVKVSQVDYQRNIMSQIGNAAVSGEEHATKNKECFLWIRRSV
jgi:adenine-specific DNA-methyltransferase